MLYQISSSFHYKTGRQFIFKNIPLLFVFDRVDKSEKKRKELEHICNFNEERIEKDEKELSNAKKTTRDAFEKYEETTRRLNSKEKVRLS